MKHRSLVDAEDHAALLVGSAWSCRTLIARAVAFGSLAICASRLDDARSMLASAATLAAALAPVVTPRFNHKRMLLPAMTASFVSFLLLAPANPGDAQASNWFAVGAEVIPHFWLSIVIAHWGLISSSRILAGFLSKVDAAGDAAYLQEHAMAAGGTWMLLAGVLSLTRVPLWVMPRDADFAPWLSASSLAMYVGCLLGSSCALVGAFAMALGAARHRGRMRRLREIAAGRWPTWAVTVGASVAEAAVDTPCFASDDTIPAYSLALYVRRTVPHDGPYRRAAAAAVGFYAALMLSRRGSWGWGARTCGSILQTWVASTVLACLAAPVVMIILAIVTHWFGPPVYR